MSAGDATARATHGGNPSALRQLQKALALALCIQVAAEHCEDGSIDFADAVAGLLIVLQAASVMLDQAKAAP